MAWILFVRGVFKFKKPTSLCNNCINFNILLFLVSIFYIIYLNQLYLYHTMREYLQKGSNFEITSSLYQKPFIKKENPIYCFNLHCPVIICGTYQYSANRSFLPESTLPVCRRFPLLFFQRVE